MKNYIVPVFYCLLACFLWGLIFLVSLCLESFHCVDVVLGRYLIFGVVSVCLLLWGVGGVCGFGIFRYWKQAGMNAIVMNFVYYTCLNLAMRLANPAEVAILIGLSPITIAVGDMALEGRISYRILVGPLICITVGVVLMNINQLASDSASHSTWTYFVGLLLGCLSLLSWTWYVLYNTRFLQRNPQVNPKQWTLLVGVITLGMALVGVSIRWLLTDADHHQQFSLSETTGQTFVIGVVTLGIVCSWMAYTLWNMASAKLSPVVSGQIAITEMVFSLLFVYVYKQEWPTAEEYIGIGLILLGIWMGLVYFYGDKDRVQNM